MEIWNLWDRNEVEKYCGKFGSVVLNIAAIIVAACALVTLVSVSILIAAFFGAGLLTLIGVM